MYSKREVFTLCFILFCVIIQVLVFSYIIFNQLPFMSSMKSEVGNIELDKVVIFSRHGIRTPLSKNLKKMTPYTWPEWKEKPGYLTDKGYLLEGYMGDFFSKWLTKEGILQKHCPSEDDFYAYADSIQRTIYSANAFVSKCFPNCNITVHHNDVNKTDPVFAPYIHNSTEIFKKMALKQMLNILNNLKLNYNNIESILDYKDSELCVMNNECDMNIVGNKINIVAGKKPKVSGPLKLSKEAIDAFLMEYYSGFDFDDVAWGQLHETEWSSILNLFNGYHSIAYQTDLVANDVAKPLIKYLKNIFLNKSAKVTLLMGHDSNIIVLLKAMSFKQYFLRDSLISIPIGGKIVFEKWLDKSIDKYLLRINYVYQSNDQLRDGLVLSMDSPPQKVVLELENCVIDTQGFCLWDDFVLFLNQL